MNGWFNPDNWLDLLSQLLLVVGGIGVAVVPAWLSMRKSLREVSDSVNNRPTSLRDDVDRAINAIDDLAHDVRGLRTDLAAESDSRRTQFGELRSDLDYRTGKHRKQED